MWADFFTRAKGSKIKGSTFIAEFDKKETKRIAEYCEHEPDDEKAIFLGRLLLPLFGEGGDLDE